MDVKERVALQRQELEAAVAKALELAAASSDAAEVAITKSTGLSVSTRMCEVEMLNSTVMVHLELLFTAVNVKAALQHRT